MKICLHKYLVSAGEREQQYGLSVMEQESPHHIDDGMLAYNYDSDSFFHVRNQDKELFIPVVELKICRDEFGNEYTGTVLQARIKDAIKAYMEELPSFVENVLNGPDFDIED